jgi:capsular polysaccharide biosynthesis protein
MSESLELFFFKRIQIFPVNSYVNVASLIIPDHIAVTGNYNIEIMTTLRKLFLSHYKDRSYSFGEKIFVSRKKATIRYIFNEEEVENELNLHGFKTVYFEDHNLEQQIAIMQNARYLIGITGANMVNMMFMPVGSSVILFNKSQNKNDNCYFSLANVFFHKFIYQFCHDQASHESDWKLIVDINKLKENLKLMLGS